MQISIFDCSLSINVIDEFVFSNTSRLDKKSEISIEIFRESFFFHFSFLKKLPLTRFSFGSNQLSLGLNLIFHKFFPCLVSCSIKEEDAIAFDSFHGGLMVF